MTEWIARRELSTVASEIETLRRGGQLRIQNSAARGSPQSKKYWDFVKQGEGFRYLPAAMNMNL